MMKILIAYDGSGYSHASLSDLQQAGLPPEADVIILSVAEVWLAPAVKEEKIETVADSDIAEYFRKYYEQANRNLAESKLITEQAKESLLGYFPHWTIKRDAVFGSAASIILSSSLEFKPDIIVVGAQGLSSFSQTGLGSISQRVLNEAACSVRVARGKGDVSPLGLRIIIGFNDSPGSLAAVKNVASRQWSEKPEILLLTVTEPLIPLIPGRVLQPIPGWSEGKLKGEQKWVETLAAEALQTLHNAGLSAKLRVCSGNPRLVFVREAEEWQADSIFVGATSFQSQFQLSTLGCVSSAIASRASCSVEVVR
jgi:nucleotide-binding universal stress UspA family protein